MFATAYRHCNENSRSVLQTAFMVIFPNDTAFHSNLVSRHDYSGESGISANGLEKAIRRKYTFFHWHGEGRRQFLFDDIISPQDMEEPLSSAFTALRHKIIVDKAQPETPSLTTMLRFFTPRLKLFYECHRNLHLRILRRIKELEAKCRGEQPKDENGLLDDWRGSILNLISSVAEPTLTKEEENALNKVHFIFEDQLDSMANENYIGPTSLPVRQVVYHSRRKPAHYSKSPSDHSLPITGRTYGNQNVEGQAREEASFIGQSSSSLHTTGSTDQAKKGKSPAGIDPHINELGKQAWWGDLSYKAVEKVVAELSKEGNDALDKALKSESGLRNSEWNSQTRDSIRMEFPKAEVIDNEKLARLRRSCHEHFTKANACHLAIQLTEVDGLVEDILQENNALCLRLNEIAHFNQRSLEYKALEELAVNSERLLGIPLGEKEKQRILALCRIMAGYLPFGQGFNPEEAEAAVNIQAALTPDRKPISSNPLRQHFDLLIFKSGLRKLLSSSLIGEQSAEASSTFT